MVKIADCGNIAKALEFMVQVWVTSTFQALAQEMRSFIKLGLLELHMMTGQTIQGSLERFLPP